MAVETITIDTSGGAAEAYVARPVAGHGPGVLLFMDVFGLRPQIASMCERIAAWGYTVVAPNVFHRSGSIDRLAPTRDLRDADAGRSFFASARPRLGAMTSEVMLPDIAAYVGAMHTIRGVDPGPIATVGFCMGARWATYAATQHPEQVAVAAGFHGGGLVTDADDSPHRGLSAARADFVYGHADKDRSMNRAAVAELDRALQGAGVRYSNAIYPGASHGYTMADTAAYDEAAAQRAFDELHAALARRLPV